jgi:hypothetical protein
MADQRSRADPVVLPRRPGARYEQFPQSSGSGCEDWIGHAEVGAFQPSRNLCRGRGGGESGSGRSDQQPRGHVYARSAVSLGLDAGLISGPITGTGTDTARGFGVMVASVCCRH